MPTIFKNYTLLGQLDAPAIWKLRAAFSVICRAVIFYACLNLTSAVIFAQDQTGTIHGLVTDASGAALPDVNIRLTSPALLVPQSGKTDSLGNYHFELLPLGTFSITFDHPGYGQFIRENIGLTAGFSAEVNVQMVVGSVVQNMTVSVAGPIIDTSSTAISTTIGSKMIADQLPITRTTADMYATTPGIMPTAAPDLGGGTLPTVNPSSYGISGQATVYIEGVNTVKSNSASEGDYDFTAMEEFTVVPIAANADVALPGIFANIIVKSGGNQFHGRAEATGETQSLESNNLTPLLRSQGNTTPNVILNDFQSSANIGGPIKKNKWWFFGGGYLNNNNRNALGFILPNGSQGVAYVRETNATIKSTYQLGAKYKLIGFWTQNTFYAPNAGGAATVPFYSTHLQTEPVREFKGEFQAVPNDHLVLDALIGHHMYQAEYFPHREAAAVAIPTIVDTVTSQNYGPVLETDQRGHHQTQFSFNGSYFPSGARFGKHQLKFGSTWMLMWTGSDNPNGVHVNPYGVPGNYTLVFANGAPTSIRVLNYPTNSNREDMLEGGIYLEDQWAIGKRIIANIGLRYDSFNTSLPAQAHPPGAFGPQWAPPAAGANPNIWTGAGESFPSQGTGSWNTVAPRVGMTWDIFGNGKTVYKASHGRYDWTPGDDFGSPYNKNTTNVSTYRWSPGASCTISVAMSGGCDYVPGSVNLNPNGPAFQSLSGVSAGGPAKLANSIQNPNLKQQYSNIWQTFIERQLAPNLSARAGYTYIANVNTWLQIPIQIPYGEWSIPYTMYDQGQTAPACYVPTIKNTPACSAATLASAPHFTIYDLQPGYAQLTQTQYVNRPSSSSDHINGIEATVTKRATQGKWNLVANYTGLKFHQWLGNSGEAAGLPIAVNPNQLYFPLNTTWNWQARATGNYQLPLGFDVSGSYQVYNGLLGQRSESVPFPNAGTTTIPVASYGSYRGNLRGLLNLRFARDFHFNHERSTLRPSLEILNSTNSAATWAVTTYNSGSNYGKISTTDTPRILRMGLIYLF